MPTGIEETLGIAMAIGFAQEAGKEVGKGVGKVVGPVFGVVSIPFELFESKMREWTGTEKTGGPGSFDWCIAQANKAISEYHSGENTQGSQVVKKALTDKKGFRIEPCNWVFKPECPKGFPFFVGFDKNGQPICLNKMDDSIRAKVNFVIEFACTSEAPFINQETGDCQKCPGIQKPVYNANNDFLGCNPCKGETEFLGFTPNGNPICCPAGSTISFDAYGNPVCKKEEPPQQKVSPEVEALYALIEQLKKKKKSKPKNPCSKVPGTEVRAYTADGRAVCCPSTYSVSFDSYGNPSCVPPKTEEDQDENTVVSQPPPPPRGPIISGFPEVHSEEEKTSRVQTVASIQQKMSPCKEWETLIVGPDGSRKCRDDRPKGNPNYNFPSKLAPMKEVKGLSWNDYSNWNNQTLNEKYWKDIMSVLEETLDIKDLSPYSTSYAHTDSGYNPSVEKTEILKLFENKFPKF